LVIEPIHSQNMSYLWVSSVPPASGVAGSCDLAFASTLDQALAIAAAGGLRAIIVQIANSGAGELGVHRDQALDLLENAEALPPVWIFEPGAAAASAVRWIRAGATLVHAGLDEISQSMAEAVRDAAPPDSTRRLIGSGPTFTALLNNIDSVASRRCNVLIEGETGTGKELVAQEIHGSGSRKNAPFIAVNCAAIPDTLLEAELFGHSKGAFTGAVQARAGKFEAANRGSIFLDEIGDMPLAIQAKLLRVIQEREVERLGGNEKIRLDVRIIAATNVDLAARVRQGFFRQDLYYRLNVFSIRLAPLRERPEDIEALARHFVNKICRAEDISPKSIEPAALRRLESHAWPGNVRELENTIESAIIRCGSGRSVSAADLVFQRAALVSRVDDEQASPMELPAGGLDYQKAVEEFEHALLTQALTRSRGNKTAAASLLRLKRTTLSARMRAIEARFPRLVA
jgi:transcriptional regulator with PAS, ATPase and Fis domain